MHEQLDHDDIHLPPPSIAPMVVAIGMTFLLVGLLSSALLVVGLVTLAAGIALWVFLPG